MVRTDLTQFKINGESYQPRSDGLFLLVAFDLLLGDYALDTWSILNLKAIISSIPIPYLVDIAQVVPAAESPCLRL